MTSTADNGIVDTPTNHSADEAVERLKGLLRDKGITLFALVDHSGEAEKTGMKMRPTKLLIFGIPRSGTPVMLAAPSIAIDLPMMNLAYIGALFLAAAVLSLGVGLIRAARRMQR